MTVPSINEQSAITAFLDCETTKIDELIAEARRVIELLKERCIALISAFAFAAKSRNRRFGFFDVNLALIDGQPSG